MNRLIEQGFGTTEKELVLDNLPVKGVLPHWLEGTFIRNGPGTFVVGKERYRHWFDGLAMLHKFSFSEGRVAYANKFLRSNAYNEAMETGKIAYNEFATDPCRSLFGRIGAVFTQKITDSAKVNISHFADKYLALSETAMQMEFDPETLDSLGVYKYETRYNQHITTVHPQFDFEQNMVYQHISRFGRISHYRLLRVDPQGRSHVVSELPVKEPAYLHSFGMSPNYLIIAEFPLVVNPLKLLFQLKPFIENFKWKPERGTTFHVINRHTGKRVRTFRSKAFFAFHHVNAFEQDNQLFVDIDAYEDAKIIQSFYLNRLADKELELPFGQLRRYQLPLDGPEEVDYQLLSEECIEMPRFDYDRYNMNADYRYVYGIGVRREKRQGFYNQIVKIDIKDKSSKTWYQDNCYPGEPVFVRAPNAGEEDDGVVISIVLDAGKGKSFLLVLNGKNFEELARAEVEQPILIGYHGAYFPELI